MLPKPAGQAVSTGTWQRDATRTEVRNETAGHLRTLYTIGAGISAAVAMERLLTDTHDYTDPHLVFPAALLLIAFTATLIPFFHGAMRHMHQAWDETTGATPGLMMFDFVLLFTQTLLFFVLADVIRNPQWFSITLSVLLMVDVVWLLARRLWGRPGDTGLTWAVINLPTIGLLAATITLAAAGVLSGIGLAVVITVIAVARSVFDYLLAKDFYFGTA